MKNYVDVKITIWQRYHFTDETDMRKLAASIREDGLDNAIGGSGFIESEILFETQSDMTAEENDNQSTIEVYQDEQPLWDNGIEQ